MREFYDKNRTYLFGTAIFITATVALFLKYIDGATWMMAVGAAAGMWGIKRTVQVVSDNKTNINTDDTGE